MLNVGLIGCGHISETYFRSQSYFNNINLIACADINEKTALESAKKYNIKNISIDQLFVSKDIDIILNLTTPQAHYATIKKTLLSGKHSYCENPLSTNYEEGRELLSIAKKNNLYLGNAPDTFLGGGAQLARTIIDSDLLGEVKLGSINFAFPGVQSFHPNPDSWFQKGGGPVIDMGPYYFTALVNLLGPAKNVRARPIKVYEFREIESGYRKGEKIKVGVPTTIVGSIEFINGAVVEIFLSFDVISHKRNHIELYGTKGSMIVPDPNMFGGSVFISEKEGGDWQEHSSSEMRLGKINIFNKSGRSNEAPTNANYRGVGLSDMIESINKNILNRCNGELALHVLDMIDSTISAALTCEEKLLRTTCSKPEIFCEKEIENLML